MEQSVSPLFSISVAILALLVSLLTLWLVHFRRGQIHMTQPTQIYFGPDGGRRDYPKILLHTMLYSTASRGAVLENMFVKLKRGQTEQAFSIWVHGEKHSLKRGSGLFVDLNGVSEGHHFLLPPDGANFDFTAGKYVLEIFGKRVGSPVAMLLQSITLEIDKSEADRLCSSNDGIYFDWGPHTNGYHSPTGNYSYAENSIERISKSITSNSDKKI